MTTWFVVERFVNGPEPVYARFHECGRMAPEGLRYVASWVTTDGKGCFQIMEGGDRQLLEEWMRAWADLVQFEVVEVLTSGEAAERFARDAIKAKSERHEG